MSEFKEKREKEEMRNTGWTETKRERDVRKEVSLGFPLQGIPLHD